MDVMVTVSELLQQYKNVQIIISLHTTAFFSSILFILYCFQLTDQILLCSALTITEADFTFRSHMSLFTVFTLRELPTCWG